MKANLTAALPRRPALRRSPPRGTPLIGEQVRSASPVPEPAQDGYFPHLPHPVIAPARRRSSFAADFMAAARRTSVTRAMHNTFNPNQEELVQPFSFVSTQTSWWPTINMTVGLLGQAGYTMGSAFIERVVVNIPPPDGVNPGVGSPDIENPDGLPKWFSPTLGPSIAIFTLGIMFGLTSSFLFLRDGLRIKGNKRKAYIYVSAHITGIALISVSRTISDFRKNKTPHGHLVALSLPASLGRGMHWVTIPRSFSNSEVTRGDFAKLTFEQRLMLSEGLRVLAAIFFGLWASSWAISDYNPLKRELWAIMGSLTLNVSAALPNTNLRRADIYRRSQVNLVSPQLQSFRLEAIPQSPISSLPPSRPPIHSSHSHTNSETRR